MVKKRESVGKYILLKRLGKGGMGTVYKALSPQINKIVALKLLKPSEALEITLGYEKLEEIFLTEAQTLASLNHQNLTTVWDFDKDERGRPFFVMEYYCSNLGVMIGESFQLESPSRQIRPEKVIHYGSQILQALEYLHHNRVIHRDIKPHNILVTDNDTVKVCDFGMALVDGLSFSGPDNMQIGSPCYTPPEQKKMPHQVDGRADYYSTAVLLYRMLTGTLPGMQSFPLSAINPVYDHNWDDFFRIGLSWDPDHRFQSSREMKTALGQLRITVPETTSHKNIQLDQRRMFRSTPENQCGSRAIKMFNLTTLQCPQVYTTNDFTVGKREIFDRATGLTWEKYGSPYPINWQDAQTYIDNLNEIRFNGLNSWRLPTVDELLSLLNPSTERPQTDALWTEKIWLWSCDLHGKTERWYINLDMGYAASQDMDCCNFVKAVRSGF